MQEQREGRSKNSSFKHKKQGVNEDALEYYNTKLQLYLHAYDEGEKHTGV